jgi:hypothetical protein
MNSKIYSFLIIFLVFITQWACVKEITPVPATVNDAITISSTNDFQTNTDIKFSANASNYSEIKWEFLLNSSVVSTSSELNPTKQFQLPGNYTAVFKAIGKDGSAGASITFTINPKVSFTVTGGDCEAPCEVTVTADVSGLAEYYWLWDDGTLDTKTNSPTTKHLYTKESTNPNGYFIGLAVRYKSTDGLIYASGKFVKIKPEPIIPPKVTHAWSAGSVGADYGQRIATDDAGNVYVAGQFSDGASFGSSSLSASGSGDRNVFVAKYNNTGALLWVKRMTFNLSINTLRDMVVSKSGNVYVAFASSGGRTEPLTEVISKIDANGNTSNIKTFTRNENLWCLGLDASENVYVGGDYSNNFDGESYNVPANSRHGFVAKYSSTGTFINKAIFDARDYNTNNPNTSTNANSVVYKLAVAKDNSIYITGEFRGKYGATPFNISANGKNTFITKFDPNFSLQWVRQDASVGTNSNYVSFPRGIVIDNDDNVFMLGSVENGSSITFGSRTLNNRNGVSTRDNYLLKYDKNGTVSFFDYASKANIGVDAIAKDAKGNIITAGFRSNTSKFTNVGVPIYQDVYLTTTLDNLAFAIASDPNNNLFVTGFYNRTLNTIADTKTLSVRSNDLDMMVIRYGK